MATKYNYGFDWCRFVSSMLPFHLRVKGIKALFSPAFKVLQEAILSPFSLARDNDSFKVTHNSQVVYLQLALNKKFKSNMNGVFFRLGEIGEELTVNYAYDENSPSTSWAHDEKKKDVTHFYAVNAVKKNTTNTFVVFVPSDLYHSKINEIKQFVNSYRLVTRVPFYEPVSK